jgi:hypothetical protein
VNAAVIAYVLVGLLFGAPDQKPNSVIDVYPSAASCEAAKVELMNRALPLTNGTTLVPAAKCVPMTRPDPA